MLQRRSVHERNSCTLDSGASCQVTVPAADRGPDGAGTLDLSPPTKVTCGYAPRDREDHVRHRPAEIAALQAA